MEITEYCDNMAEELQGWKSKLDKVQQNLDSEPCENKDELASEINDMRMIIQELGDRIGGLKDNCPDEWSPERTKLDTRLGEVREKWEVFKMTPPGRRLEESSL